MAEYQLTCFAQSGNAYKVALMLALTGADWEPVFVDFFNGETRTPDYLELNEMGEVPVLIHGELRLSQSGVILDYLAARSGQFGPRTEEERREILRWTLWDNHRLTGTSRSLRFMMKFLPEEKRDQAVARLAAPARREGAEGARPSPVHPGMGRRGPADDRRSLLRRLSLLRPRVRPRHRRSIPTSSAGGRGSPRCPAGGIPTT